MIGESWQIPDREPWMARGACIGEDPDVFFPSRGPSYDRMRAFGICAGCEVRHQCLQYALKNDCRGIWGATTDEMRNQLNRRRMRSNQRKASA